MTKAKNYDWRMEQISRDATLRGRLLKILGKRKEIGFDREGNLVDIVVGVSLRRQIVPFGKPYIFRYVESNQDLDISQFETDCMNQLIMSLPRGTQAFMRGKKEYPTGEYTREISTKWVIPIQPYKLGGK